MKESMKTMLKLSAAAASVALLFGCATQTQLDEAKAMAEAAMDEASTAMITAEGAETLARNAQGTADDNAEKIDRMFERSMYK